MIDRVFLVFASWLFRRRTTTLFCSILPLHSHIQFNVFANRDGLYIDKVSLFVLQELLLEITLDSVFEYDRLGKKEKSTCGACGQRCRSYNLAPGKDIYGRDLSVPLADKCECLQCGNSFACARYAPHLEKCLGMGRNARPRKSLLE